MDFIIARTRVRAAGVGIETWLDAVVAWEPQGGGAGRF